jgi:asparagine synthase (glutamine-hydrolysing)
MCGICGFIDPGASAPAEMLLSTVKAMCDRIAHRGPDNQGQWADPGFGVALGHRRLSIIDVSEAGNQPMTSPGQRYVIVFNGEIYNFREIAGLLEKEKKAPRWRGHSDTEVMLAAFDAWGVERSLGRFNGMFAFVAWDTKEKRLVAGRDRCGKKPLYYGWTKGIFVFGSELKALAVHPAFSADIDRSSLAFFLRHSYIPSPQSIYANIKKLPQASFFSFGYGEIQQHGLPVVRTYWNVEETHAAAQKHPFIGSAEEACDRLEELLTDSVRLRMISYVPLGAFLSGGIDSSLIVSLMRKASSSPVKTFTIGFPGEPFDESGPAAAVASYLGTEHIALRLTAKDALDVVPRIPELYDEPFADDSQIPTWLLCRHCRDHVTVALSGDGGDELFAGYDSHRRVLQNWPLLSAFPGPIRSGVSLFIDMMEKITGGKTRLFSRRQSGKWKAADFEDYYRWYMSYDKTRERLTLFDAPAPRTVFDVRRTGSLLERMLITDFETFLTDDVLVKVDRASMNVALEVRCPLLDYRVIEFAWSLPPSLLTTKTTGKLLLRRSLYRHVPRHLVDRPKASFGIPLSQWLKTDLHDWAADMLAPDRLHKQAVFDVATVQRLWETHCRGNGDFGRLLWNIVMFEAWHSVYMRG